MANRLPEFDTPPVVEVVIGVQFEKLDSLRTPQLGYVWNAFRDRFPKVEEQPPLEPVLEQFGPRTAGAPRVRLELSMVPPRPRLWFLNELAGELVQVQQDRFIRNWRKQEDSDEYPRYRNLRRLFQEDFELFCRTVEAEQWGTVEPNQCEVTYVNIIPAGEGWHDHGELERVITLFSAHYSDDGLGKPEEATVNLQYVLKDDKDEPVGRLHIDANPVQKVSDNQPAIRLTVTARGKPLGVGIEGAMQFLDRGHEAIVRGFTSITTSDMHRVWKRTL
jgi:uncharacterized protein (TIGR04255 family)